jgi:hypothetical protein
MANTDYTRRGTGGITPSATLGASINRMAANLTLFAYAGGVEPAIGMGLMINQEIMRVTSVDMPLIGVARGCADTVPAQHDFGDMAWFFTAASGTDAFEYMGSETIGVKLLMRSNSGAMAVENSPPNALTFNSRFARPYPPGNLKINGNSAFATVLALDVDEPAFVFSWAHRDRVTQGDQLIGHEVGDIGPEPGTTYVLKVYDDTDVLKRTIDNISGNTVSYSVVQAIDDLGAGTADGTRLGYFILYSHRDGYDSFQSHRIEITANSFNVVAAGWGNNWGSAWGTLS